MTNMTRSGRLQVVTQPKRTALDRLVSDYLAHKQAGGLSPRTVEHYERILQQEFLPFLRDQGVTEAQEINQRVLDRFSTGLQTRQRHLVGDGPDQRLSKHSTYTYLNTVGHFVKWCQAEGEITSTAKPQLPRLPRRVLTVLTRQQIRDLEDAATSERDKLVVRLLADTGMRLGELLGLTEESLIEQGRMRYLKVHGKGDKERMIPLAPDLHRRLTKYIEKGRPQDTSSDHLFLTLRRSHRTGDYSPLEERATQEMFDVLRQKAGIPDNVPCHPHSLRHAFATNALRKGIGLIPLQHILGHANLTQITMTYSHLTPEDDAAALLAVLRQD